MKNSYLGTAAAALIAAGMLAPQGAQADSYRMAQEGYVNEALHSVHDAPLQAPAAFITGAFEMHELRGATLSDRQEIIRDRLEGKLAHFDDTDDVRKLQDFHRKAGGEAVKSLPGLTLAQLEDAGSILLEQDHKMRQGTLDTIDAFTSKGMTEEDAKRTTLRLLGSQIATQDAHADLFASIAHETGGKLTAEDLAGRAGLMREGLGQIASTHESIAPQTAEMTAAYEDKAQTLVAEQAKAPGIFSKQFARWFTSPHKADRAGPNPTREAEQISMGRRADLDPARIGSKIADFDKRMAEKAAARGEGLDDQGPIDAFFSGSQQMAEAKILEEVQFRRDFLGTPGPVKSDPLTEAQQNADLTPQAISLDTPKAEIRPEAETLGSAAAPAPMDLASTGARIGIDMDTSRTGIAPHQERRGVELDATRTEISPDRGRKGIALDETRIGIKQDTSRIAIEPDTSRIAIEPDTSRIAIEPDTSRIAIQLDERKIPIKLDMERIPIKLDTTRIMIPLETLKLRTASYSDLDQDLTRDERVAAAASRKAARLNSTSERDARVTEMAKQRLARSQGAALPKVSGQEIE